MDALLSRLDELVLKPEFQPLLSLLKGARNGVVYGSKVRFPHALVIVRVDTFLLIPAFLYPRVSSYRIPISLGLTKPNRYRFRQKIKLVLNATRLHARNLATFAIIYKFSMIVLRNLDTSGAAKEGRYDSFFAGLMGGYAVFGRQRGSISQQIVIYVFARVMLAIGKLAIQPNMHPLSSLITPDARTKMTDNAWPVFASMTWASVMYIFRWYPDTLASSLRSSMVYIYADSDHWDSLRTLLLHNK
ncbi:hypothetical protein N7509_001847 [Penicillium cosmopolitanum]|uniref:Peroxisomal membrane protein 4 n=1 Tax=Penicillium cosmopolitanum TaxID=1131564 RepID=A0A9W9W7X1_9EURO|nr:uncharacterized protein N7509_001847 [Penicillium cosmopolitanum]KAJ5407964.1 hypothetical protein N7509_001847 [Penicillium cosmopolitanum]